MSKQQPYTNAYKIGMELKKIERNTHKILC